MRTGMKTVGPALVAVLVLLSLAFAAPVAAKGKEYLQGTILDSKKIEHKFWDMGGDCHDGSSGSCDHVFVILQVEDMTYQADYEHHRGLMGMHEYKFKEEDWPVNGTVEVRFEVKHFLGIRRTFMFIKSPKGKEIRFVLFSKTGPDGKELCGKWRC